MIAIALDLFLATLLICALLVGLRLERRLKVLRDSQTGFAAAVIELNAAMAKAQQGLADLKAATTEAQTDLTDRIQDARGVAARLDQKTPGAAEAAVKLEAVIERATAVLARGAAERTLRAEEAAMPPPHYARSPYPARAPAPAPRPAAQEEEPLVLRPAALSRPAPRSRAPADDDLFEAPLSMRPGDRR